MSAILLLGAGASIPFFEPKLSTTHLTGVISDRTRWENLLDRYIGIMGSTTNPVDLDVIIGILTRIQIEHPDYNFEQIIEIIDKICSFNFNPLPNSKIFHDILLMNGARPNPATNHVWDCVPFLFRQLITEEVSSLRQNNRVATYNRMCEQQRDFVSSISDSQPLNIFTLNYDEIILDSINTLNFETGFDESGRFSLQSFLSAPKTISFPHGHSRFSYDDEGILYHQSSIVANGYRLNHIGHSDRTQTHYLSDSAYAYSFNTFISTGQQKEPTFDVNPYATYYQKFASDCLSANRIYVVGYSFSDPHFNRMMLSFLKRNLTNKLIVVDFIRGDVNVYKESFNSDSFLHKLLSQSGIDSVPMKQNPLRYRYSEQEDALNRQGYAEIYPQIILYKKGYDGFLAEYQNVLA